MSHTAANIRVIITRPLAQAEPWGEKLHQQGFASLLLPVLAIDAVDDPRQVQAIKNIVIDFDLYQKAIFVSQNAVAFGIAWLEDYWPQLPAGVEFFAVGETTAKHLQDHGLQVTALQAAANGAMNSESLLQCPQLQQVAGEKIVIFRGCGGRGHMGDILSDRGARVDYCELYRRALPSTAATDWLAALSDDVIWQKQNIIALHSGESLQHYVTVLQQLTQSSAGEKLAAQCRELPLLVPGQRVADLAQAAGFRRVFIAENATDQAMSAALVSALELI